ncbi:MAG: iron-containing alcohol dehydrogenase [Betaproteobacteria bacterium]
MQTITYLTTIQFGFGARSLIAAELRALGIARPLIVTDRGIAASGVLAQVTEAMGDLHTAARVFTDTPPNPTEAAVRAGVALYSGAGCDGIVAIGGGSSIDLAKGIALMATHPWPLAQYAAIGGGIPKIMPSVAPVIAIPTTSGTGSEVGRAALLTLDDGRKLGFISPHLIPKRAICDPELTLGLPPQLTAATGMDALTHCFETYLSPRVNPPAEAIALDGAARAVTWIARAVENGGDRDARWQMQMASLQGGLTFQKGLGAVHSMSHPLGGLKSPVLHHGTLNAVILPAVLRFNAGHVGDKYHRLRAAIGGDAHEPLDRMIMALNRQLGLPAGLGAMGVTQSVVPAMVEGALADHSTATNPRPVQKADFERLFAESW